MQQQVFRSVGIFLLVLIVLKFVFRLNISIIGSIVLTIIVALIVGFATRR